VSLSGASTISCPKTLIPVPFPPPTNQFTSNDELDLEAFSKQVERLAKAGMGLVLFGTNGEAVSLRDSSFFLSSSSNLKRVFVC
jgi:hypothetical protein